MVVGGGGGGGGGWGRKFESLLDNITFVETDHEIISTVIMSLLPIQDSCQLLVIICAQVLVNRLEDLRKVCVELLTCSTWPSQC